MQYLSSFVWFISLNILSLSPLLWTRFSSLLWLNKLIIQEMQIKIMRYHFIPVRKSVVKKTKDNRCWRSCWCECKLLHPLWKTVWRYLKKLELELPYDPAIPLLDIYIYLKEVRVLKKSLHSHVYCRIIHKSQDKETT